jgi:NAD+ diphosphatase
MPGFIYFPNPDVQGRIFTVFQWAKPGQITRNTVVQIRKVNVLGKDSVKQLLGNANRTPPCTARKAFMTRFAFAESPLDRCGNRRNDLDFVGKLRESQGARFVHIKGDLVRMDGEDLFLKKADAGPDFVLLGTDPDGCGWFACPSPAGGEDFQALRGVMLAAQVPAPELSILAQARSLVHWHETHGFCAKCGSKTEMADQGYRRHCASCGADHFPRTDPVVIMIVKHGDRILLGRQASWPEGMLSALAGFTEPGETLEDAVRREVREESGLIVGRVDYVTSQPWPFPSSLMIGCLCNALTDEITVDTKELEMARWFTRDDVRLMLDGTHPDGFKASNPYAIAHHLLRTAIGES